MCGNTLSHFQSERHSVSICSPCKVNGPLRQGINCFNNTSSRCRPPSDNSSGRPKLTWSFSSICVVLVVGKCCSTFCHCLKSPCSASFSHCANWPGKRVSQCDSTL